MPEIDARRSPLDLCFEASLVESHETFAAEMTTSMLFPKKGPLRRFALMRALQDASHKGMFVEFGVANGAGMKLFSSILTPLDLHITGFDGFVGLEEDWTGHHNGRGAGGFGRDGIPPEVPGNIDFEVGWIQDTLPGFLKKNPRRNFSFIHMDFDTYTPTAFALKAVKKKLKKGTVILFDELYGYPGWRHHEYKALKEVLDDKSYRYIGFSTESVAIQMV